jgi:hypothetical protein
VNQYNVNFETEIGIAKAKLSFGLNDEVKNWYTQAGTLIAGGPAARFPALLTRIIILTFSNCPPFHQKHPDLRRFIENSDTANTEKSNLSNGRMRPPQPHLQIIMAARTGHTPSLPRMRY